MSGLHGTSGYEAFLPGPDDREEDTSRCVVEGCDNEGTLEFMGEYVCPGHLADFTESCYDRMMDKEGTDVR